MESEAELAFAGLHQLLDSIAELVELLPDPRRRALRAALGIAGEFEPDPFLVALAAYQVIRLSASSGPLVVLVDDAQWLDRSTLGVLTFIARRLETEPVALLAAVRVGLPDAAGGGAPPGARARRLSAAAAGELLDRTRRICTRCFAPVCWRRPPGTRWRWSSWRAACRWRRLRMSSSRRDAADAHGALGAGVCGQTARPSGGRRSCVLLAAALDARASLGEARRGGLDARTDRSLGARRSGPGGRGGAGSRSSRRRCASGTRWSARPCGRRRRRLSCWRCTARWPRSWPIRSAGSGIGRWRPWGTTRGSRARSRSTQPSARRRGAVMVAAAALERAAALTADPQRRGERLVRAADAAYELGAVDVVAAPARAGRSARRRRTRGGRLGVAAADDQRGCLV